MNGVVPFGLHSAPKIFNPLVDALPLVMYLGGVCFGLHYLDDCQVCRSTKVQLCGT